MRTSAGPLATNLSLMSAYFSHSFAIAVTFFFILELPSRNLQRSFDPGAHFFELINASRVDHLPPHLATYDSFRIERVGNDPLEADLDPLVDRLCGCLGGLRSCGRFPGHIPSLEMTCRVRRNVRAKRRTYGHGMTSRIFTGDMCGGPQFTSSPAVCFG